jgi:hypothetical protein
MAKQVVEVITPEVAKEWLDKNTNNRPISQGRVELYAEDMRNGRWTGENGQTIVFSSTGELMDGQHRLSAIVASGKSQRMLVVRDVRKAAFDTIDNGRARTPGDILALEGIKNSTLVASIARSAYLYIAGYSQRSSSVSRIELTDFVTANPYIIEVAAKLKHHKVKFWNAAIGAVIFLGNMDGKYSTNVSHFLEGLSTGTNLNKNDARYALREWEINQRTHKGKIVRQEAAFAAAARAWNAWVTNRDLVAIKSINNSDRKNLPIIGFRRELFPNVHDHSGVEFRPQKAVRKAATS